ncbi:hypothetical protein ATKI12_4326 [Kitasatospora sp. Ki12]
MPGRLRASRSTGSRGRSPTGATVGTACCDRPRRSIQRRYGARTALRPGCEDTRWRGRKLRGGTQAVPPSAGVPHPRSGTAVNHPRADRGESALHQRFTAPERYVGGRRLQGEPST